MTPCANSTCKRGFAGDRAEAKGRGRYCSTNCATAVRMRKRYARQKAGVILRRCEQCAGKGFFYQGPLQGEQK